MVSVTLALDYTTAQTIQHGSSKSHEDGQSHQSSSLAPAHTLFRLTLLYQILKMMYSLDPATFCGEPDGFLLAPLPGRKQLWEAPDNAQAWIAEKSQDGPFPSVFGVLANGQMVRLYEQQVVLVDEINFPLGIEDDVSASNWEEWCAGMDGFGALVTLATSLAST